MLSRGVHTQIRSILFLLMISFVGCSDGSGVDKLFNTDNTIEVPSDNDLTIAITVPATDGSPVGYQKRLSGTCGTAGKPIEIYGDATGYTICGLDKTWTATVNTSSAALGSVTVNARMIDEEDNLIGLPATRILNKITTACDSSSARLDTFANTNTTGVPPWIVCTAVQLSNVSTVLSASIELGNDIDIGGAAFTAIGTLFTGTFEGHSFEISNFSITSTATHQGLFRETQGATIQNLYIKNATIQALYRAGGLVGVVRTGINVFSNIHLDTIAITTSHASVGETGGMIGHVTSGASTLSVSNSSAQNVTIDSKNNTGGLIGYINDLTSILIVDSYVSGGTVVGNSNVGGLIGYQGENDDNSDVQRVYSTADVTGSSSNIGGLVGQGYGDYTDVYATGTVTRSGGNSVGGLFGRLEGAASSLVGTSAAATRPLGSAPPTTNSCYATGNVIGGSATYSGGLIGYNRADTIQSCYATGSVTGGITYIGGLIGMNDGDTVDDSFATGNVLGEEDYVGGLVGYSSGATLTITNSYAEGNVTTTGVTPMYIGGLVGRYFGTGDLLNIYAEGNISADLADDSAAVRYIGGLLGSSEQNNADCTNCYATGSVSVTVAGTVFTHQRIGGLMGYSRGNITSSYATGSVTCAQCIEIGGLVGYQNQHTISLSYATGNVIGFSRAGGLVGYSQDTATNVSDTYATGNIISSGAYTGGLVGVGGGNIYRSYAAGNVVGNGSYVGGLEGGSTTSNRYLIGNFAVGSVDGGLNLYVGGLSGYIRTTTNRATDNFAYGNVRGGQSVGGLFGVLQRNGSNAARRNYSTGKVFKATGAPGADSTFGPIVGTFSGASTSLENGTNFYNSDFFPEYEAGGVIAAPNLINMTPLTSAQMAVPGNFSTYDFGLPVWEMPSGSFVLPKIGGPYSFPIPEWAE